MENENSEIKDLVVQKKSKKGLIIASVSCLVIIVFAIWYVIASNATNYYKKIYSSAFDMLSLNTNSNIKTLNFDSKFDFSLEVNELLGIDEELVKMINDIDLLFGVKYDKNTEFLNLNLGLSSGEGNILDARCYLNAADKSTIISLPDFYEKNISVTMDDEFYKSIENIFSIENNNDDVDYAIKALKEAFVNTLKDEYCSKISETVSINENNKKMTKYVARYSLYDLAKEYKMALKSLKNDEEFIKCLENDSNDIIITKIDDIISSLDELMIDETKNIYFEIDIYNSCVFSDTQKIVVILDYGENDSRIALDITKKDDGKYSYEITIGDISYLSGDMSFEYKANGNTTNMNMEFSINDILRFGAKIDYTDNQKEKIIKPELADVVDIENISGDDFDEVLTKIEESGLSDIITVISNLAYQSNYSDSASQLDFELLDNQIVTYDYKTLLTVGEVEGAMYERLSDNYICYYLEDGSSVIVSSKLAESEQDIYDEWKDLIEMMKSSEDYKNFVISAMTSKEYNGRKYFFIVTSYDYVFSEDETFSYKDTIICSKVSDESYVVFEVTGDNFDLNKILTVSAEDI